MALLPEDMSVDLKAAIDELESAISEMESRLEATRLERDGAKGRQVELEIENANLRRELGRARERSGTGTDAAREQQAATANILRVIARAPSDLQPVFETIAESARRLCEGHTSLVTQVVGDAIHLAAASSETEAGTGEMLASFPTPLSSSGIHSRVASSGELAFRHDMENEPDLTPEMKETARARGYRSILVVPMLREGVAIGTIGVTRREAGAFPENLIELLRTFADEAVIAIENARLIRETREALERQTATAGILKVIASSPSDVQPVFDAIAASAKRLLGGFSAAVFRYVDGMVRLAAFTPTHPAADQALQADFPTPVDDFAAFRLAAHGQPFPIPDTEQVSHAPVKEIARLHGFRSMLWVPMVNAGVTIGVLSVTRAEPGAFAPHHTQLLQTFADQAVIAIENTRLFNEVQARTEELSLSLQQQTATADVLKVISRSAFDLKKVLDTLIESAVTLGGSRRGGIFFCEDDVLRLQSYFGFPDEQVAFLRANPLKIGMETMAGRAALLGRTVHIPDILEDRDFRNFSGQAVGKFRAFLGVPLKRDGKVFGVLAMNRPEPGPFSERQIDLVQTFADQAVIAIENVRLFDEVQARTEELSESLQQQTAVGDVLKVISRTTFDLQPVLDTLVNTAAILCGADMAFIMRRAGDQYRAGAAVGYSEAYIDFLNNHPLTVDRGTVTGRAVLEKHPVQILDVVADPEYTLHQTYQLANQRTALGVPLLRENEPIGTIVLARTRVEAFTQKQIDLVTTFADQAVIAIENVRLFDELRRRTGDLSEALTYQTGSGNILRVIASSPTDVQPVLKAIVESACELCEAYDAIVRLRVGDTLRAGAHHGQIPISTDEWTINRDSASGRVILEGRPIHVRDMQSAEGDEFPESQERARRLGHRTILSVPLIREGERIGVIILRRTEVRPFTDKQIALLQTFADQAVIAIGNVRLFEQLQERTRELSKSLDELRAAQDRLVQTEKLASLGQLTAGIAHEIKNPLNFVNNFAALSAELTAELKDALKPADLADKIRAEVEELIGLLKDNLEKIVQHGKRADSIIKNMLLHSREGSGEHRPSDINALVDESLNLAYHGARAEKPDFNVTLERDFDTEAGEVDVFPQEIARVFLNLVSNGFYAVTKRRKESEESGFEPTLRASTRNLGNAVEIRIRDNGTGIPSEVKEKMFNPFFTTKPAGEGTGLGLSMSHDIIVKQHGGTIDVDTQQGHFTEFRIVLPRTSNFAEKSRGKP